MEKHCWRGFSIDDLAEAEPYSLEVGPYTSDVLSDDELAGITWQPERRDDAAMIGHGTYQLILEPGQRADGPVREVR